jgi:hypothetical protein
VNVFTTSLIHHGAAIQGLLRKYSVEANVNLAEFGLVVRGRNRYYRFYPQFIWNDNGRVQFSPEIVPHVRSFVGWRPYFNKRFAIGFDKTAFKDFCARHGLRTPQMWRTPAVDMREFLVKHHGLSFGQGIHGPFRSYDAGNPATQALPEAAYYEAFVQGDAVKALYWQDRLVCLEIEPLACVTGDGKRTLRDLIAAVVRRQVPKEEWTVYERTARYQELDLDAVPEADRRVMVDFRFANFMSPVRFENQNRLPKMGDSALVRELRSLAPVFWAGIPEELREATLFSVDGIVDERSQLWLLEMNCNPACHPDAYDAMFETLFGAPESEALAPVPHASALPPYVPGGAMAVPAPMPAAPDAPPPILPSPPMARAPQSRWLS